MSTSPTRAIIDLSAYAQNIEFVRRYLEEDCGIMAIIKANAYGHGAVPIAKKAMECGVQMLGVATVDEAIELRQAGITAPILVLVQPMSDSLGAAVEYDLRLMISDVSAAERLGEIAQKAKKVVPIHCKVDSGMGRQGFELDQAVRDMLYLTRISHIDIEGIATHFPVADLRDDPFTMNQIRSFKHFLKQLDKGGVPYELVHAANSAAIVNHKTSRFNMVRPGLMTYGVWPTATPTPTSPLAPVLRWETRVVMVKEFEPGSSIGYGRTYTTNDRMRGAILPLGYADGYKHSLSNAGEVLIRGRRCPVRGSVCMDQMVVDVTTVEGAAANDVVTLIGRDGNESITVEDLARQSQTIPYDILTSIGPRVRREYIG